MKPKKAVVKLTDHSVDSVNMLRDRAVATARVLSDGGGNVSRLR